MILAAIRRGGNMAAERVKRVRPMKTGESRIVPPGFGGEEGRISRFSIRYSSGAQPPRCDARAPRVVAVLVLEETSERRYHGERDSDCRWR
jgi:hypothetical protein